VAILLAHPRLYWGETGAVGAPSLIDLPLPFVLTGQSGWGRSLHFLAAWASVLAGVLYLAWGFVSGHVRHDLIPAHGDLTRAALSRAVATHLRRPRPGFDDFLTYNVVQRLAYLSVVLLLFPAMIWTGLAMSPAITSVLPFLVNAVGGQQSARTLHFVAAVALVLFVIAHLVMVILSGWTARMRGMITGRRGVRAA
jgi:thiosulfate reductase cytochrome b subunit